MPGAGLLGCEETCMEDCSSREGFDMFNTCVEECMVYCVVSRDLPARVQGRI